MPTENHTDYDTYLPHWQQVRAFVKGMDGVKTYLRKLNPTDTTNDNAIRNKQYKDAAVYTNVSSRTRNALVGAVFRKDPTLELPAEVEYMEDNANGAWLGLVQLSKAVVGNIVEVGRHGLLVDYPKAPNGLSAEESAKYRAKIVQYKAETIKYWQEDEFGTTIKIVLIEKEETERHLLLINGVYIQRVYDKDDELIEQIEPKKYDGSTWDEIPFVFVGSQDNSPDVDPITLLDIVSVSRGHYQNSADYEDLLSFLLPTAYGTVPNKQWMDEVVPSGVYSFGSGGFIPIPDGGSAGILQATANQMHQEAMKHKEEQMVMLGARLITDSAGNETATAVRIRYSGDNSVLDNLAQNASMAISQCLMWACQFMKGNPEAVDFELNRDFFDTDMSPQEIMALIQLADRGDIAQTDIRNKLRKTGTIKQDRTDEEIDEENAGKGTM